MIDKGSIISAVRMMDSAELDELVQVVQNRRNAINAIAACNLQVGTRVSFTHKYRTIFGVVESFHRGNKVGIGQCSDHRSWRCPAGMLKVIA
jgi:hypothetical protein